MNKRELESCIKVLRRAIEYPNQESLKFVLDFLEEDLRYKLELGNRSRGIPTEEAIINMQVGRTKAGLNFKPETIKKWARKKVN